MSNHRQTSTILHVKVQRPIAGDTSMGALIYDRARQYNALQQLTPDVLRQMGKRMKVYFEGAWDERNNCFSIGAELPDQSPGW